MTNLATTMAADQTTLDSVTFTLAIANTKITSLKENLNLKKILQKNKITDSSMEITAGPVVFDVGVITLVYPASGLETATKKRQPRLTKW